MSASKALNLQVSDLLDIPDNAIIIDWSQYTPEEARQLFATLDPNVQRQILEFLRSGDTPRTDD